MRVVPARDDRQVTGILAGIQPALTVDHLRKLAKRHAVDDRDRKHPDTGPVLVLQDRAVHIEPVGVGPVQDQDLLPLLRAGLHKIVHRDVVGVVPEPHVLNVHYEDVEPVHILVIRSALPPSIHRNDRNARLFIHRIPQFSACVLCSPEPMLGAKYSLDPHSPPDQRIQYVLSVGDFLACCVLSEGDQGRVNRCFFIRVRGENFCGGGNFDGRRASGSFAIFACSGGRIFFEHLIPDNSCLICKQRHALSLQQGEKFLELLVAENDLRVFGDGLR